MRIFFLDEPMVLLPRDATELFNSVLLLRSYAKVMGLPPLSPFMGDSYLSMTFLQSDEISRALAAVNRLHPLRSKGIDELT